MTDLENLARQGYEIHGSKHQALVKRAWTRGYIWGVVACASVGVVLDLLGVR